MTACAMLTGQVGVMVVSTGRVKESPELSASLKSSGKSRADLWSYAAKVAVEFSIEQNKF